MLDINLRSIPDIVGGLCAFLVQRQLGSWLTGWASPRWKPAARFWTILGQTWILFGFLFSLPGLNYRLPYWHWLQWLRGMGIGYGVVVTGIWIVETVFRLARKLSPAFSLERRKSLQFIQGVALAAPAAAVGYGAFLERNHFRTSEIKIPIPNLPKDLQGIRLVQVTDIHFGPYLDARDLAYAIEMANNTRAHIALVTGDLITTSQDPLDECLRLLTRLKADAGVVGCLGNHEIFAGCEDYVTVQGDRMGMQFLRKQSRQFRFGSARINFAGVDYQKMGSHYLRGVETLIEPGALNVLLSHNPDVFPVAADLGYDLTVAGHTHGGQVTVEILNQYLNFARFYTPYVSGLYRREGKTVYVSRGLGTVGVPARVGAPPEVSLIELCAT